MLYLILLLIFKNLSNNFKFKSFYFLQIFEKKLAFIWLFETAYSHIWSFLFFGPGNPVKQSFNQGFPLTLLGIFKVKKCMRKYATFYDQRIEQ